MQSTLKCHQWILHTLCWWQMHCLQITMCNRNEPPNACEEQPWQNKTQSEHNQRPSPLGIHQCGENILQKSYSPSWNFLLYNITVAKSGKKMVKNHYFNVFHGLMLISNIWNNLPVFQNSTSSDLPITSGSVIPTSISKMEKRNLFPFMIYWKEFKKLIFVLNHEKTVKVTWSISKR